MWYAPLCQYKSPPCFDHTGHESINDTICLSTPGCDVVSNYPHVSAIFLNAYVTLFHRIECTEKHVLLHIDNIWQKFSHKSCLVQSIYKLNERITSVFVTAVTDATYIVAI